MKSSVPAPFAVTATLAFGLSCILLAGCGGGAAQAPQKEDESGATTEIELASVGGSGASGTAAFSEVSEGVEVALSVRGLPDPEATYLAHIHPGTCAEEGREERAGGGHSHEGESHEPGGDHEHEESGAEIEYPLAPLIPDAEGDGSSTSVLEGVTTDELFSGDPKYVNAHASGTGDPPVLVCGDLPAGQG